MPAGTLRTVLTGFAIALKDTHTSADATAVRERVWLGPAPARESSEEDQGEDEREEGGEGKEGEEGGGRGRLHGVGDTELIVRQSTGNAHELVKGSFFSLHHPAPSLDRIICRYTPRGGREANREVRQGGDAKQGRGGGMAAGEWVEGGRGGAGGLGPSVAAGEKAGGEVGGGGGQSFGFVHSLVGLVDPRRDASTRLQVIRKQFNTPAKGTDFAAQG